jgi:hypothetical protein
LLSSLARGWCHELKLKLGCEIRHELELRLHFCFFLLWCLCQATLNTESSLTRGGGAMDPSSSLGPFFLFFSCGSCAELLSAPRVVKGQGGEWQTWA